MLNRYQGNTGRVVRIDDGQPPPKPPVPAGTSSAPPGAKNPQGLLDRLTQLLPRAAGELDTEDIILLLILYLMYRESGDSELLIIMGAMFLL